MKRQASKSEHTPGPWEANSISMENGDMGVAAPDLRISICHVHNAASFGDMLAGAMKRGGGSFRSSDCFTQFANARLIAAAPDLDKACDEAWKALAWVINYDSEGGTLKRAVETIEAARKKAGTFDYDAMRAEVDKRRPKSEDATLA